MGSAKQSANRFKNADGDAEKTRVDEAASCFLIVVLMVLAILPVADGDFTKNNKIASMHIVKIRRGLCAVRLALVVLLISEGSCIIVVIFAMVVLEESKASLVENNG